MAGFSFIRFLGFPSQAAVGEAGQVLRFNAILTGQYSMNEVVQKARSFDDDDLSRKYVLNPVAQNINVTLPVPDFRGLSVKHFIIGQTAPGKKATISGIELEEVNDQVMFASDGAFWTVIQLHLAKEFEETLDEANAFTTAAIAAIPGGAGNLAQTAGGRLSLTKDVPVTPEGSLLRATIFYTPYTSDTLAIWDGTEWIIRKFDNPSFAVPIVSEASFDIFATFTPIGVSILHLQWLNDFVREFDIKRQDGIWVLADDERFRYLGSFREGPFAGSIQDDDERRHLWNQNNRVQRKLRRSDAGTTWGYGLPTFRVANNNFNNRVEVMIGNPVSLVKIDLNTNARNQLGPPQGTVGIGIDTVSTSSADTFGGGFGDFDGRSYPQAKLAHMPSIGIHKYFWLEKDPNGPSSLNWFGNVAGSFLSGMVGTIDA